MTDRFAALTFLTGETFDGARAAAMGLVTRALPETDLDAEIDEVAPTWSRASRRGSARPRRCSPAI